MQPSEAPASFFNKGNHMSYMKLIRQEFNDYCQNEIDCSKNKFIGETVFGFTTYEDEVIEKMTIKAIEVCRAISDKKTFEYIENEDGNFWYLILVNMPFFKDKLEWGTSIRGTWWALYPNDCFKISIGNEWVDFDDDQWDLFIKDLIRFTGK